nr:CBS domain containing protein [Bacillus wiedmannii]
MNDSGEEALHIMNETGFRAIPVLAEDEKKFIGIIYKVDLLEKKCNSGLEKLSTEHMLGDSSAFIFEKDSFFRAFYVIRRLPFLAVLNDYNEFVGILTHSNIFDVIEDSFGMRTGGYILTIATQDCKGTIKELGTLLKAFNIGGLFTLDNGDQYIRRVIVNIADELNEKRLKQLIEKIEKKGFRVSHVDYI